MNFGISELLIILVIVLLIFGVGRISQVANELGRSVRAFREGLNGAESSAPSNDESSPQDHTA